MKREYKRALQESFARRFLALHGEFERQRPAKPYFSGDELVLRADGAGGSGCFVIVSPHGSGHDAFTVEVGWSKHGGQPKLSMRPSAGNPFDATIATNDDFVTRLAYLDDKIPEFWYLERPVLGLSEDEMLRQILESTKPLTAEEADARVQVAVREAVEAATRIGVPFLMRRLRIADT